MIRKVIVLTKSLKLGSGKARKKAFEVQRLLSGDGGNRTPDTRIFSPLLYQLSYITSKSAPQRSAGAQK
jgi:hypothetical protein